MTGDTGEQLNALLDAAGLGTLNDDVATKFAAYLELILRWNQRMNLTAIRAPQAILARHFVESIACAKGLPTTIRSVLDLGSGAGFPGIPVAICRSDLSITLAESQSKKAAFLNEAVRVLRLHARVFAGRAELIGCRFDCVTMRAVDRMQAALKSAKSLIEPGGYLAVLTTSERIDEVIRCAGNRFSWKQRAALPESDQRVMIIGELL